MMQDAGLRQLLTSMDVRVESFELEEISATLAVAGPPLNGLAVHYVLHGVLEILLPGKEARRCPPGTLILVPPGMAIEMHPGEMLLDDTGAATRVLTGIVFARISPTLGLLDRASVPIVEDTSGCPIVRHACAAMLDETVAKAVVASQSAIADALMKTCILTALRQTFQRLGLNQDTVGALGDPRIVGALAMILDKPGANHSVARLAARCGVGRSALTRLFTDVLGSAPMEFVAKARLHHAASLLRNSPMPIKAVAPAVGFASRSHFSRVFRDAYGTDPRAYRSSAKDRAQGEELKTAKLNATVLSKQRTKLAIGELDLPSQPLVSSEANNGRSRADLILGNVSV